jgi:hypothetical protein
MDKFDRQRIYVLRVFRAPPQDHESIQQKSTLARRQTNPGRLGHFRTLQVSDAPAYSFCQTR